MAHKPSLNGTQPSTQALPIYVSRAQPDGARAGDAAPRRGDCARRRSEAAHAVKRAERRAAAVAEAEVVGLVNVEAARRVEAVHARAHRVDLLRAAACGFNRADRCFTVF